MVCLGLQFQSIRVQGGSEQLTQEADWLAGHTALFLTDMEMWTIYMLRACLRMENHHRTLRRNPDPALASPELPLEAFPFLSLNPQLQLHWTVPNTFSQC